ncbi:MAG: hypothetical protein SA339_04340 [Methanomassiliicoccus sp.]|nr:hypothetical protein [Methanomassiliicoccus sp.]
MILRITSPSRDMSTKTMYEKFMAGESVSYCLDDHPVGAVMGAREEEDGYVLTVNITNQTAFEHYLDMRSRRVGHSGAYAALV